MDTENVSKEQTTEPPDCFPLTKLSPTEQRNQSGIKYAESHDDALKKKQQPLVQHSVPMNQTRDTSGYSKYTPTSLKRQKKAFELISSYVVMHQKIPVNIFMGNNFILTFAIGISLIMFIPFQFPL
jgi:hypothetical protein